MIGTMKHNQHCFFIHPGISKTVVFVHHASSSRTNSQSPTNNTAAPKKSEQQKTMLLLVSSRQREDEKNMVSLFVSWYYSLSSQRIDRIDRNAMFYRIVTRMIDSWAESNRLCLRVSLDNPRNHIQMISIIVVVQFGYRCNYKCRKRILNFSQLYSISSSGWQGGHRGKKK